MQMNAKMSDLMRRLKITYASDGWISPLGSRPFDFATIDGSVLLKSEYDGSRHITLSQFPDRTGYEAFVNHFHLPFDGTRESLLLCLASANSIQEGLARLADARRFQVVVSVSDDCTVRFYEIRPGENWLADEIESYAEEAILVLESSPE
jgi:hypothetical protein